VRAADDKQLEDDADERGESRAPLVATLLVAVVIPWLLPERLLPGPRILFPALILVLMCTMLVLDPGRIDRRSREVRLVRIGILVVLIASSMYATLALTYALVLGAAGITDSADQLLRAGALVWLSLMITFAFLFWELDVGGPGERAHVERHCPDLAFPQDLNPAVARPDWRPTFIDYLYLGLTNNLAFSPTDVMPLAHWAKIAMGVQSIASLVIIGLVVARAVNIFPGP